MPNLELSYWAKRNKGNTCEDVMSKGTHIFRCLTETPDVPFTISSSGNITVANDRFVDGRTRLVWPLVVAAVDGGLFVCYTVLCFILHHTCYSIPRRPVLAFFDCMYG